MLSTGNLQAEISGIFAWELMLAEFHLQFILFTATLQHVGSPYEIALLSWGSSRRRGKSCRWFATQIPTGGRAKLLEKTVIRIHCVSVSDTQILVSLRLM